MTKDRFDVPVLCFPGHILQTSKISSTARVVLDAIFLMADNYNLIILDESTVKTILHILGQCDKSFTEQTLRNSVSELFQNELLLRLKNNHYYLNPTYFLKHSIEEHRNELLTTLYKKGLFDHIEGKGESEDNRNNHPHKPEAQT